MILREEPGWPLWNPPPLPMAPLPGQPPLIDPNFADKPEYQEHAVKMDDLRRRMREHHASLVKRKARAQRWSRIRRGLLSIRGAFLLVWFCLWALIAVIAWGCSRSEHETLPGLYKD